MKVHVLEIIGEKFKGSKIGDTVKLINRNMKVTQVENVNETTNRLTLED